MAAKRNIAVVITHRTPYGRLRSVLRAIKAHPDLELKIIVGVPVSLYHLWSGLKHTASFWRALPWYVRARLKTIWQGHAGHELLPRLIVDDGFSIDRYLPMFIESGNLESMLTVQANVLYELPRILGELKPDVLLVHADRFEMLPVAMVGAELNIPVAHTQGGDVSGTFDEIARHAITKLSHIHFPTTEISKERIIQMGEDPRYVFMTGCPTIDVLTGIDLSIDDKLYERVGKGYGDQIDMRKPFLFVLQHPVTSEYAHSRANMEALLKAVQKINMPTLMFWPNIDGGTDGASAAVRTFLENHTLPKLALYKTFKPDDFYRALNAASVAVGNSSSFIREGSYLGVPAVLVGTRQDDRERAENITTVGYSTSDIVAATRKQLSHGHYKPSNLYGDGTASKKIANFLATIQLPSTQKTFYMYPSKSAHAVTVVLP